jgi:hypothetical protein
MRPSITTKHFNCRSDRSHFSHDTRHRRRLIAAFRHVAASARERYLIADLRLARVGGHFGFTARLMALSTILPHRLHKSASLGVPIALPS